MRWVVTRQRGSNVKDKQGKHNEQSVPELTETDLKELRRIEQQLGLHGGNEQERRASPGITREEFRRRVKGKRGGGRRSATPPPRRWPLVAALLLIFVIGLALGVLLLYPSIFDKPRVNREQKQDTLLVARDKTTVMIMGVDQRDDDVGRSDTLMIASVDPTKRQATLLSIPRDTRVRIQGHGWDKINSAFAYGGHDLTQSTVEDLLDTPIDHYVLINTRAFPKIIDAIGGIELNVEQRMYYVDAWDDALPNGLVIDLYPGMQHLNGEDAMAYVRYRDEEGDIGRVARQQKFMRAVMDKVTSTSIIPQLPNVIRTVMDAIETDLSFRQILELAGALREAQANGLWTETVEGRPLYIEDVSYWIPDIVKLRTKLARMLDIELSERARKEMERDAARSEASIPSYASSEPSESVRAVRKPTPPTKPGKSELPEHLGKQKSPAAAKGDSPPDKQEPAVPSTGVRMQVPVKPTKPTTPAVPSAPETTVKPTPRKPATPTPSRTDTTGKVAR